jgi:hypothetical protein
MNASMTARFAKLVNDFLVKFLGHHFSAIDMQDNETKARLLAVLGADSAFFKFRQTNQHGLEAETCLAQVSHPVSFGGH